MRRKIILSLSLISLLLMIVSILLYYGDRQRFIAARTGVVEATEEGNLEKVKALLEKYPTLIREENDLLYKGVIRNGTKLARF